jgi:hypothetical protein
VEPLRKIEGNQKQEGSAMGSEMATALPGATFDGGALFAHSSTRALDEARALLWAPAIDYPVGERVRVQRLVLPQVRRTHALIGARSAGAWGCLHGVNEQGVAMGTTPTRTRLGGEAAGLTGADLVRLTLERSSSASQAVETTADLITRHGQGSFPGCSPQDDHDHAFLIADAREAYLLAACGSHWAVQQVAAVRALNEVCHVRQDWDRLSPGLAGLAIRQGWWPEDGSKLDFDGALAVEDEARNAGYRWWGRATLQLELQRGAVDIALLRRLLADSSGARPDAGRTTSAIALIAQMGTKQADVPLAWCSFGPFGCGLYFPLPVVGEPPAAFRPSGADEGCELWRRMTRDWQGRPFTVEARTALADLQGRFDQMAGEFLADAAALKQRNDDHGLRRLAESFVQHNWERFEELSEGLLGKEAAWETACQMDSV